MRFASLTLVIVLVGSGAVIAHHAKALFTDAPGHVDVPMQPSTTIANRIREVQRYRDLDYDFSMAVPAGWQPIVTIDGGQPDDRSIETGHAVGFEAPRDGQAAGFADYVLIEILPGSRSGRFMTDGTRARPVRIGGMSGVRESLAVDGFDMGREQLDLVVHQAEVSGVGFTIGFYAIGEPSRRALLEEAFELMIRTFDLDRPPFRIS